MLQGECPTSLAMTPSATYLAVAPTCGPYDGLAKERSQKCCHSWQGDLPLTQYLPHQFGVCLPPLPCSHRHANTPRSGGQYARRVSHWPPLEYQSPWQGCHTGLLTFEGVEQPVAMAADPRPDLSMEAFLVAVMYRWLFLRDAGCTAVRCSTGRKLLTEESGSRKRGMAALAARYLHIPGDLKGRSISCARCF